MMVVVIPLSKSSLEPNDFACSNFPAFPELYCFSRRKFRQSEIGVQKLNWQLVRFAQREGLRVDEQSAVECLVIDEKRASIMPLF